MRTCNANSAVNDLEAGVFDFLLIKEHNEIRPFFFWLKVGILNFAF